MCQLAVEVGSQRLVISPGRLQAGVDALRPVLPQPGGELREAGGAVREGPVLELTRLADEAGVEGRFRDIEAERPEVVHGLPPGGCGAGPALLMRAQLTGERPRDTIRPVWRALQGGAGGLISPPGLRAGCRAQPHRRLVD